MTWQWAIVGLAIGLVIGDQFGFRRCMYTIQRHIRRGRYNLTVVRSYRRRVQRGER